MKIITAKNINELDTFKKVGFFVGSFDPAHKGHISIAIKSLNYLDFVLFYPVGDHSNKKISKLEKRLISVEKAVDVFAADKSNEMGVLLLEKGGKLNNGGKWEATYEILSSEIKSEIWLVRGLDKITDSERYKKTTDEIYKFPHLIHLREDASGNDFALKFSQFQKLFIFTLSEEEGTCMKSSDIRSGKYNFAGRSMSK